MRDVNSIIIHCSDTHDNLKWISAIDIDEWHRAKGWNGIGYHYVVRRNGHIDDGRPEGLIGAHVLGHNRLSLGLCWVGRGQPTPEQYTSLLGLIRRLLLKYGLNVADVKGHYEFNKLKTCPNLDMNKLREDVEAMIDYERPVQEES